MEAQERLEALEKEVRRLRGQNSLLRLALLGLFLLTTLPYIIAATKGIPTFSVVRAQRFEVVAGQKVVAVLSANPNGGALVILNDRGKEVAALYTVPPKSKLGVPKGGSLFIGDMEGKSVALLGAFSASVGALGIWGGGLEIYNKEGKLAALLGVSGLDIYNKEGKRIAVLGADLLGDGGLWLWSSAGLLTFSAPMQPATPRLPSEHKGYTPPVLRSPLAPKVYAGVGSGHWIEKVMDNGAYILLEDGSLWEVSLLDRFKAALWLPLDDITVSENIGLYPYKLINTSQGEVVEAKYVGQR